MNRMTEKRYYTVDYDEQYYIFDSNVIRKGRVEEEAEYSYDVFADSMSSDEIVDLLNEQDEEITELKQTIKDVYGILCIDVDVFSDKATEHDINAYIELRELDNKDAYYIAKGTKKAIELLKKVMIE